MAYRQETAWGILFAVAALTVFMASLADLGLRLMAGQIPQLADILKIIANPNWFSIREASVGLIIGISAFSMLQRGTTDAQVRINTINLWSLILCIVVALLMRSLVPLYGVLMSGFNLYAVVGAICGVFWQSRRYWRR